MRNRSKPRVLYIVYWGAAEPLGQSLVLPAVKRLAAMGVDLTLVTFDKPADLGRLEEIGRIRESLDEAGVQWMPLRYHKSPKVPATAYDIAQGCARAIAARVRSRFEVVHARTFIGGLMGLLLAPILGAKLIYHNEGFYPDEQVDAGVWQAGSRAHRIAKRLEQEMYARADAIIALSHRAKAEIENFPKIARKATPVIVVPSCVDLNHFGFNPAETYRREKTLRFVYSGSVGGRYMLDRIGRFVAIASKENRVHLRVLTRTSPDLIGSILNGSGLRDGAWSVDSVAFTDMPQQLASNDAGLCFLTQGISEHGCSSTKIGEYWAAGLPVITTPNVSDTDEIIRREHVGVVLNEHTDDGYARAAAELRALLEDDQLSMRCRQAAEAHYALEPACERQASLYHRFSHDSRTTSLNECSAANVTSERKQ